MKDRVTTIEQWERLKKCGVTCGICGKVIECETLRKFTQKLTEV